MNVTYYLAAHIYMDFGRMTMYDNNFLVTMENPLIALLHILQYSVDVVFKVLIFFLVIT
jgi:hypothetical protein